MSKEGSIGVILEALRKKLNPWLGEPKWKLKEGRATFIYRFGSESQPIIPMHLKIEINIIHESILQSMAFTTKKVSRAEFEENMSEKLNDIAFIEDIKPLLPRNIYDAYNRLIATKQVQEKIINTLLGEPWKCKIKDKGIA